LVVPRFAVSPSLFATVVGVVARVIYNDVPWCVLFGNDVVI